jgi:hypothetical protein
MLQLASHTISTYGTSEGRSACAERKKDADAALDSNAVVAVDAHHQPLIQAIAGAQNEGAGGYVV